MDKIKRGDIVFVQNYYKEPHGSIICGNRPAVVIQNDIGNEHSSTLIVAYLTSQIKRLDLPSHVVLQWYPGLTRDSMIAAEQIATISKEDVTAIFDHLREEDMVRMDKAVKSALGLEAA